MNETHQPHPTPFEARPSSDQGGHGDRGAASDSRQAPPASEQRDNHHLLAGCSYLGILFIVPLLMDHKDEFVRFHLRQGIALFALGVLASFGFHYRGGGSLLMFAVVIISLVAAFRAWRGEKWVLPVIGKYAAKIEL